MSFILTAIGTLLLLLSLAGISFGVFMAADRNTREPGWLFALGWVPAVAASSGVLMRDAVTFTVGLLCFLVAGVVFVLEGESARRPSVKRRAGTSGASESLYEAISEEEPTREQETTEEDKPEGYGKAAS